MYLYATIARSGVGIFSGCIVCELRGSNARSGVAALAISDERTGSIRHLEVKEASVYFEIIKGQL